MAEGDGLGEWEGLGVAKGVAAPELQVCDVSGTIVSCSVSRLALSSIRTVMPPRPVVPHEGEVTFVSLEQLLRGAAQPSFGMFVETESIPDWQMI